MLMTESIDYEVIRSMGPVEIRKYPMVILATVNDPDDDTAFSILFRYISGDNEGGERIAMTAPVVSQRARGERIEMTSPVISDTASFSFALPSRYDLRTAPRPLDPRVRIIGVPSRLVAALRFSGRAYAREVIVREDELLKVLKEIGIATKGSPFLMRYNSPFAPGFLRRNEVGVEVVDQGPVAAP
jgi:hypothetical protein